MVSSDKSFLPTDTLQKIKHAPTQDLTPLSYNPKHVAGPSSPRRIASHSLPQVPRPPAVNDETHFFDRVKRVLDNRDLYNEFLKLVNLFAQDYIDTARLVKESRNFLGNTELYKQFRNILGWDDKKEREHLLAEEHTQSSWTKPAVAGLPERPGRIDFSEKYGSYRKVSARVSDIYFEGFLLSVLNYCRRPMFPVQDEMRCVVQCSMTNGSLIQLGLATIPGLFPKRKIYTKKLCTGVRRKGTSTISTSRLSYGLSPCSNQSTIKLPK